LNKTEFVKKQKLNNEIVETDY